MSFPKEEKLVSFIIPFVDELGYLDEAVASCLDQGLKNDEIIVVCNHSVMISEDQKRGSLSNPKIVWIHEPERGSAQARNKGLFMAKGEWIQFLDADDILMPGKVEEQMRIGEIDVVVSPHTYRFLDGKEMKSGWHQDDVWYGLLASKLGSTSSMLWKREALIEAGGWNVQYKSNQEYELLFRILKSGRRVGFLDQSLTLVRERERDSISKNTAHDPFSGIRLREEIWNYLLSQKLDTTERYEAFRTYVFKNLRAVFIQQKEYALSIHEKYFRHPSFTPHLRSIPLYGSIYKVLGFRKTEELMAFYRKLRAKYLKGLPVNR